MAVRAAKESSPAQWVVDSLTTFAESVASIVPAGFEAYARILHPAWVEGQDGHAVSWAKIAEANGRSIHPEVQFHALIPDAFDPSGNLRRGQSGLWDSEPSEGCLDRTIIQKLIPLLGRHTSTAETCYFAYWNGWGDPVSLVFNRSDAARTPGQEQDDLLRAQLRAAPRGERDRAPSFATPHREWYLYEGTLKDAVVGWYGKEEFLFQSASMWWPEDHTWFISTEVDFDSTYVGGSRSCIDTIVGEPSIEAVEVDVGHGITWASDRVNPNPHRKA